MRKTIQKDFFIITYGPTKLFDITPKILNICKNVKKGFINIFSKGSTGALLILPRENQVIEQIEKELWNLIPVYGWKHPGNAYAHLRSTLTSTKIVIPVVDGKPVIGESRVYFVENQCYVARDRRITLAVHGEK